MSAQLSRSPPGIPHNATLIAFQSRRPFAVQPESILAEAMQLPSIIELDGLQIAFRIVCSQAC